MAICKRGRGWWGMASGREVEWDVADKVESGAGEQRSFLLELHFHVAVKHF